MDSDRSAPRSAGEWPHPKKDGTEIIVEGWSSPIVFKGRQAWLVLAHDVTEQRRLEAQLRQAQKMEAIGRLAGGVAHDFNNLLTVILGYCGAAPARTWEPAHSGRASGSTRSDGRPSAPRRSPASCWRSAASRCSSRRVLDLNARGRATLEKMLRRLIGEDIELVPSSSRPSWARVKADPGQIEQVVLNLAVNARDAMPEGGTLTIETANAEPRRALRARPVPTCAGRLRAAGGVATRATGMTPETHGAPFEPFFTTKDGGKGTGLGLATVYGIVSRAAGYICVDSEPGGERRSRSTCPRSSTRPSQAAAKQLAAPPHAGVGDDPRWSRTRTRVRD